MKLKFFRELNEHSEGFTSSDSNEYDKSAFVGSSGQPSLLTKKIDSSLNSFEQSRKSFLQACNKSLFDFLKEFLNESFLFSALSYKNSSGSKPVEIVAGDDKDTQYNFHREVINNWKQIRTQLAKFLREMQQGKVISLTSILLSKDTPFDLFFTHCDEETDEQYIKEKRFIQTYDLSRIKFFDNFSDFREQNEQRIKEFIEQVPDLQNPLISGQSAYESRNFRKQNIKESIEQIPELQNTLIFKQYAGYIRNYKKLAASYINNNNSRSVIINFIKAAAFKSEFNILLSLATNRFLTEEEYVFIKLMIFRIISETSIEKLREVKKHATSAAISQVLARNMSHNIGSHVSYHATNIAIKKRIAELYPQHLKPESVNKHEKVLEWMDYMSEKLDKYEIHRNEYLADYSLSPQTFYFYKDIILPFCENTLILDNIASMEGANFSKAERNETHQFPKNRLIIRTFIRKKEDEKYREIRAIYPDLACTFSDENCTDEITLPDNFPYLFKNKNANRSLTEGINSKRIEDAASDVEILIHSEQGLYSILENFIRNSAKHNKDRIKEKKCLEIRLHLMEEDDRYALILSDNVSNLSGKELFNKTGFGLYQRVNSRIIGDGEQENRQNLGFADMNINSYLFRFNPSNINGEKLNSNLHLVKIENEKTDDDDDLHNLRISPINKDSKLSDDGNYSFGYLLELLKPRKILWIGEDASINDRSEKITSFIKDGIFYFENIRQYLSSLNGSGEIAAFDFVVFYKSLSREYWRNQIHFPARMLVVAAAGEQRFAKPNIKYVDDFNNITDANHLLEKCWTHWLDRFEKPVKAYIYYENNSEAGEKLDGIELDDGHSIKCVNNIFEETVIGGENIAILYDHHGYALKKTKLKLERDAEDDPATNFYTTHSKVFFDKGSDDFAKLNYLPDDHFKRKILSYQLLDAATTNIFILDERIATLANEKCENSLHDKPIGIRSDYDNLNFSRMCYGKIFAMNNITTGRKNKPIHSGIQNYYLSLKISENLISIGSKPAAAEVLSNVDKIKKDILILHRTYLNKENLGMDVKKFLALSAKRFGSVIITSGGGYPHSLPIAVKFVPFSIVERCINSRISKLWLTSYLQKLKFVL